MTPYPVSVSQLSRDTGVSDVTLYNWRKHYRKQGVAVPSNNKKSEDWSAEDKLAVVIETASYNEIQLSEYCRSKGLYKEQIEQWEIAALSGYQNSIQHKKNQAKIQRDDKNKIKKLERELSRKEKALAETNWGEFSFLWFRRGYMLKGTNYLQSLTSLYKLTLEQK